MKVLKISQTLRGEGPHIGSPSLFIYLAGCPVKCDWCDSKFAWKDGKEISERALKRQVKDFALDDIVITGGEPLLYYKEIGWLAEEWRMQGKYVFIETSGVLPRKNYSRPDLIRLVMNAIWIISPKDHVSLKEYEWMRSVRFDDLYWKFVWMGGKRTLDFIKRFFKYVNKSLEDAMERDIIFIMPFGKTRKEILKNAGDVWEFCLKHKFRYSPREHILVLSKCESKLK